MLGVVFESISRFFIGGTMPEPVTLLFFGIGLFAFTGYLRSRLIRNDAVTKKLLREMNEIVVVNNA